MIRVERFSGSQVQDWDSLIDRSRNGTFLLKRSFISYHLHLFNEVSLIVYLKEETVAVLPLNEKYNIVYSYGGLTYGGMIYKDELRLPQIIDIWNACIEELSNCGYAKAIFKLIPEHYTKMPSEESKYALFLKGAKINRVDTAFVVDRNNLRAYQKRRMRSIKRATKSGFRLVFDDGLDIYWNDILTPNLLQKHGVKPVHSLEEISLLKDRFPDNIKQVNIYHNEQLVAGTTLFLTDQVAHAQYISGNDLGRNGGFLDLMFKELIESDLLSQKYFDFGIANEQDGKVLNKGLTEWKESFGATTSCHFFYELNLT